jgi:hypothetical protein
VGAVDADARTAGGGTQERRALIWQVGDGRAATHGGGLTAEVGGWRAGKREVLGLMLCPVAVQGVGGVIVVGRSGNVWKTKPAVSPGAHEVLCGWWLVVISR